MIRFALRCDGGHHFESWFPSGAAFDEQTAAGLVSCPACASSAVAKAIMAPSLGRRARGGERPESEPAAVEAAAPPELCAGAKTRAMIAELRQRIIEQSDDLGPAFAEEALKIHHGVAPDRAIRGEASLEEARALVEEGVQIMPIPPLPGDLN